MLVQGAQFGADSHTKRRTSLPEQGKSAICRSTGHMGNVGLDQESTVKAGFWVIATVLGLAASPALAENPPNGVYDCFGPSKSAGRSADSSEGIRSVGTQFDAGEKFSVLSPGVYLSRGGKTGHFSFDGHTLSMTDGPYAGIRYHKVSEWSFRMLRENRDEGPFMCPINLSKDPHKPTAW